MGGNVFKSLQTDRIDINTFHYICGHKITNIMNLFFQKDWYIVRSYTEKSSFGDIDILHTDEQGIKLLKKCSKSWPVFTEISSNGPCTSVALKYENDKHVQVDLIYVPQESFKMSKVYFDFNDFGNLVGKVAHALGLKFGHLGLFYILRDDLENFITEIPITRDPFEALEFLRFPKYPDNFLNLEEIFTYIAKSEYFKYGNFKNLSHKDRIRDTKRPTYQAFLKWIESNEVETGVLSNSLKKDTIKRALNDFPKFRKIYFHEHEKFKNLKKSKEKFNGNLVSRWTGLEGKELGRFMKEFKSTFSSQEELVSWINTHSYEDVENNVKKFRKSLDELSNIR